MVGFCRRDDDAFAPLLLMRALSGCVVASVRTALDIVTFPVKTSGEGLDLAKTSQSEAGETRGEPCPPRPDPLL